MVVWLLPAAPSLYQFLFSTSGVRHWSLSCFPFITTLGDLVQHRASTAMSTLLTCLQLEPLSWIVFFIFTVSISLYVGMFVINRKCDKRLKKMGQNFPHIPNNMSRDSQSGFCRRSSHNDPSSICLSAPAFLSYWLCPNACCCLLMQWLLGLLSSYPLSRKETWRRE